MPLAWKASCSAGPPRSSLAAAAVAGAPWQEEEVSYFGPVVSLSQNCNLGKKGVLLILGYWVPMPPVSSETTTGGAWFVVVFVVVCFLFSGTPIEC